MMNRIGADTMPPPTLPESSSMKRIVDCDGGSSANSSYGSSDYDDLKFKSRIFPSTRFFMALLLCLCFVSLAISSSNISVAFVCMIKNDTLEAGTKNASFESEAREKAGEVMRRLRKRGVDESELQLVRQLLLGDNESHEKSSTTNKTRCEWLKLQKKALEIQLHYALNDQNNDHLERDIQRLSSVSQQRCPASQNLLDWSSTERGYVLAAQNAGALLMLATGTQADRLNSKWMIVVSMSLLIISNIALPLLSSISVWLAVASRVLTGFADALLQPSTSSMITRWFPPKERPFAIGLVTGGRQIGTLLVFPIAGFLCDQKQFLGGWHSIFYISAMVGSCILMAWLLIAADKPSKQGCIRDCERRYIEKKIEEENLGKRKQRKTIPWRQISRSVPLYAAVAALVCHEYPLVIMLQLLPMYLKQVLHLDPFWNGIVASLPIGVLFVSKTMSSSLSSYIGSRKSGFFVIGRTRLVKIFNAIASLGLAVCTIIVPFFNHTDQLVWAVTALCLSAMFAGLHTPGVQTALLQLAPAYTGIVTGIAFGVVAIFSIINKIFSTFVTSGGTLNQWRIVFGTSAAIAILPVFFFTIWGSADRQPWATIHASQTISTVTVDDFVKEKHVNTTGDEDQKSTVDDDALTDDESVVSALRLRMFLSQEDAPEEDSTDGQPKDEETGPTDQKL